MTVAGGPSRDVLLAEHAPELRPDAERRKEATRHEHGRAGVVLPSRPRPPGSMRLAAKSTYGSPGALEVAEHRVAERLVASALLVGDSIDGAVGLRVTRFTSSRGFATLSSRSMMRSNSENTATLTPMPTRERQHDDDREHRP